MDDPSSKPEGQDSTQNISSKPKVLIAIGHSCGLAAAIGLFIAISAYSSDPSSGMVTGGLIVTVVGVVGFLAARIAASRRSS